MKRIVPASLGLALLLAPSLAFADRTPQERALDAADRAARMLAAVRAEIAATADELPVERWTAVARICREAQHEVGRAQIALRAGVQFARDEAARKLVQP